MHTFGTTFSFQTNISLRETTGGILSYFIFFLLTLRTETTNLFSFYRLSFVTFSVHCLASPPPPPSYPIVVMNLFTTANNFSYMWIFFSWSPKITGCVFRWGASAATRASVVSHACRHRTTDAACVCVFRREGTHYPLPRPQMSGRAMLKEFLYVFGININADCFRGGHPSKNANGVFKIYTSLQSVFMQRCSVILTALLH